MSDGPIVVATFKAKEGKGDELIAAFTPTIEGSHGESGCVKYALHRGTANADTFVLVERWASQADLEAHFTQPHMASLGQAMGDLVDGAPSVEFLSPVPLGDPAKGTL